MDDSHTRATGLSRRVRCYLRSSQLLDWLPARLLALHRAVWLGLLESQSLNELTHYMYSQPDCGFDSEEHNSADLWPWEDAVVQTSFTDCKHLLVAGAGGGREVIALAKRGFEVTAFDFSEKLTTACRRHTRNAGVMATVLDAPPDKLPDGLGIYDGIIAGRGFYHHIHGRQRRIQFLKACRTHIAPGGPLFLSDFFTRPLHSSGHHRIARVANAIRRLRFSEERVELGDWVSD